MAKRYMIEEIRASNWQLRLRDADSGESIYVPLEVGARWPGEISPEGAATSADEVGNAATPIVETPPERSATKKRRKAKASRKEPARAASSEESEEAPSRRDKDVEVETVAAADAIAFKRMQTMMRHARGRRAGKRGELGWDETTDAGRSGLVARFGNGAFKILHAGGDTYALFFEWEDGRYDRLGCGAPEDLMNLANERAQGEPPEPPPSHLGLELARLYCGTPEQKPSAAARARPVASEASEPQAKRVKTAKPAAEPTAPNAEMDSKLTESLKRALADLDAREAQEKEE